MPQPTLHHWVAVVRIELVDVARGDLIIDLLEVSHSGASDRLLGRAVDAAGAAAILQGWIGNVLERSRGGAVTVERRPRDRSRSSLQLNSREEAP